MIILPRASRADASSLGRPRIDHGYRTAMTRKVVYILLAVVVLAGLVLFSGPLVRALTMGLLVAGLMWYGLAGPYFRGRRPRVIIGDTRAPEHGAGAIGDVSERAYDGWHGFRNRQTWLVAGWLSNEHSVHDDVRSIALRESDAHDLGLSIRVYVGEHFEPGLVDDLSVVDWDEIGAAWLKQGG